MYVWAYAAMRAVWFTILIIAVAWVLRWSYTVHPVIPFVVLFGGLLVWQKKKIDWAKWIDSRVGLELGAHDVLKELVILKRMHDLHPLDAMREWGAFRDHIADEVISGSTTEALMRNVDQAFEGPGGYRDRKKAAWRKAYDIVDNIDYMDSKNRELAKAN